MKAALQVALDRLRLDEAVRIAAAVAPHADWVEVGTSLIKEFGMASVSAVVDACQDRPVLADMKTNDNADYEFTLAFDAGAAAATVMGTAPDQTLDGCFAVARERGATVMVDLLGVAGPRVADLLGHYEDGVFAVHVSKDVQESGVDGTGLSLPPWASGRRVAVAGGITLADVPGLLSTQADLTVIVGSGITGADDPTEAAARFADALTAKADRR